MPSPPPRERGEGRRPAGVCPGQGAPAGGEGRGRGGGIGSKAHGHKGGAAGPPLRPIGPPLQRPLDLIARDSNCMFLMDEFYSHYIYDEDPNGDLVTHSTAQ